MSNLFKLFGRWISFFTWMSVVPWLMKKHILNRIIVKRLNMPKFIELIKTENKIEVINLSMFIMKSFEIRKKPLFWLVCTSRFLFVYTCSWFVYMSLYLFMYNECIYVSLLTVYWEPYLPIVLWNKLLKLFKYVCGKSRTVNLRWKNSIIRPEQRNVKTCVCADYC